MPKLLNRPPKYRLHKSTGQAVVSIHGKVIQLGPFGSQKSHARYQEEIANWRAARQKQEIEEAAAPEILLHDLQARRQRDYPVSIDELALAYLDFARGYYRKNGRVTREAEIIGDMLRVLVRHHSGQSADEFGPVKLKELRERMIDEADWCRKHINRQVSRLTRMFKWAVANELIGPAVYQALTTVGGLKRGRTEARETGPVTPVEDAIVEKTLPFLPRIVADMVRLQRLTGCRPGEVCTLRPGDLDQSEEVWVYEPGEHKMEHHGTSRLIMLGPKAQKLLALYLDRHPLSPCFLGDETVWLSRRRGEEASMPLNADLMKRAHRFAIGRGTLDPYNVNAYRIAIHRACEKAGHAKWSPNQLRHTAATEVRKQFGLEAAQVVCGHQSADVTQIYAERDVSLAKEVARKVG
ncbi:site-specific tyrosine recombinase XerC [Planctomycetes bacterium MalM25]|nr:site-specific tyrosine recombinase XerC [Planctomycetes bacterium MalM25]